MKRLTQIAMTLVATAALSACGSSGSSGNQSAAREPANENTAARAVASNPFVDAERKMNQSMTSAVGSDVGDNWARKMIAHHQGAIDMSQAVLAHNPKPDVAMMAHETIDKQQKDIENIRKLLKNGAPDQKSADLYRPAMMDMQGKMETAKGADVSETFMRKMLEHHKGAIAMSDIALRSGVSGALRTQIQQTRDDNQKEAAMVEAMLSGASMSQAMASSGAKSAAHDMNSMGNMDMNHM